MSKSNFYILSAIFIAAVFISSAFIFTGGIPVGSATHCSGYMTQSTCTADTTCAWDTTFNHCYDKSTSTTATCSTGYYLDTDVNYCVANGSAKLKGNITDSSGLAVSGAQVNVHTSDWSTFRGNSSNSSGAYAVADIPAGTYLVDVQPMSGSGLISPSQISITLSAGQILVKDFILSRATKTITGTVKRSNGTAVTDARVNAWNKETGANADIKVDATGTYTLLVGGGLWEVHVYPENQATANWNYNEPPKSVLFASDATSETKIVNFTVVTTDSIVKGKVLKPDGTALPADSVFVNLSSSTGGSFGGSADSTGAFSIKIAAGTYEVFINVNNPEYNAPKVASVTISSGLTIDLGTITLVKATKTITGTVKRSNGVAVTDARVNAWNKNTGANSSADVSSTGNYTISVTGGSWDVFVFPSSPTADWNYNEPSKSVLFANDATIESRIVDFVVATTDATIKGKIVRPDGTAPALKSVSIDFRKTDGMTGFGASVDSTGAFTAKLASGTYEVMIFSNDPLYAGPTLTAISVATGETKDLGTIYLVKANKIITGKVTRSDGTAVTNAMVNAWKKSTSGSSGNANTQVDSAGNYKLQVTGGVWEVSVFPSSPTADWNYNKPPESVLFADDTTPETKTINFTVVTTDATIIGKILKPDGLPLPRDTVNINFFSSEGFGYGSPVDETGAFKVSLTSGTYNVSIWSNDKTFAPPALSSVTVAKGATKDLGTITLVKASKIIKGKVSRSDGRAVTDAGIGAFNSQNQSWLDAQTDSSGNYSLLVAGGSWEISVHPKSGTPDWTYNQPPQLVTFASDQTTEERIVNFTVITADATLKGKILMPDGTAPPRDQVWVNAWKSEGFGSGGSVDSSGAFSIALAAGTYNVSIYSQVTKYSAPQIPSVTIKSGEIKDIGTITLITKNDHIKGQVTDQSGKGLSKIRVDSWQPEGAAYSWAVTDLTGFYDILVTPGIWEVNAFPEDPTLNYYNPDPPKRITVTSGVTATVNFKLLSADAGISGTVVDAAGNVLTNLYGHADLMKSGTDLFGGFGPGIGGPIDRGSFSFKAPAGTYTLNVFLPPDMPYTAGSSQTVTLTSGQTTNVKVTVSQNNSKITGILKDSNGSPITGIDAQVFASSQKGSWQEGKVDRFTGKYTISVSAGTWYLGYHVDPASGYLSKEGQTIEVVVAEGATVSKDLVITKANSKILGRVTDPAGKGVPYVFVDVSLKSFSGAFDFSKTGFENSFVAGGQTDQDGNYSIAVPAGSYYLRVFIPPHLLYIAPEEKAVTAPDAGSVTVNFQLRKGDLRITGQVLVGDIAVEPSFVWGWSEKGGYQETVTMGNGKFELPVSGSDIWHVAAASQIEGVFYKANEITVTVAAADVSQNIYLKRFDILAAPATKTTSVTNTTVVESSSGVSVVAPANSFGTSGSVSINITPDTRVSSQGETKVVGLAYSVEARDDAGALISKLNSDLTISMPYSDADVLNLGVSEDKLGMSFWDELAGAWRPVDTAVVNKADNIVTATVGHLTRFAIVSAADVTPPAAPTGVTATALGDGKIKLVWTNPVADFSHAKVYRSTTSGQLGNVRISEAAGTTYTDTGITNGTKYYYTVRAVDPAGNESSNTAQVSVTAIGTSEMLSKESVPVAGIVDGDLIKTSTSFDIYIVKLIGAKQFKRLILNPAIFNSYGHLKWENVKTVSQSAQDSYTLADLVIEVNPDGSVFDPKVYRVSSALDSDVGQRQWLNMTAAQFTAEGYDWDAIYKINHAEASPDFYPEGARITPHPL